LAEADGEISFENDERFMRPRVIVRTHAFPCLQGVADKNVFIVLFG
jgi:hypothetical protein